jgi:hypothetical protein
LKKSGICKKDSLNTSQPFSALKKTICEVILVHFSSYSASLATAICKYIKDKNKWLGACGSRLLS